MMPRILIFFALVASFFLPLSAGAGQAGLAQAEVLVSRHCRLWIAAPDSMQILPPKAGHLMADAAEAEYRFLPDFGFVLPQYWVLMPWELRVRVNQFIAAQLKQRFAIPSRSPHQEECLLQTRMQLAPEDPALFSKIGPNPRRLDAVVLTTLPPEVPATYRLYHDGQTGWQFDDIVIYGQSMRDHYQLVLSEVIREKGNDGLRDYLAGAARSSSSQAREDQSK